MPNLRNKTWTTSTPASVTDAQFWEDHLISDSVLNSLNAAKHTHGNKTVLDSLSKDIDDNLYFKGNKVSYEEVEWQQNVTEGTKIAEITIDGETTEVYIPASGGGGGGGGTTTDYSTLTSKPKINNIELIGNKTALQLGLISTSDSISNNEIDSIIDEVWV